MGVRSLIKEKNGWLVCGEATNGKEAVAKVQELAPDVVILDLTLPVMNGFQAAAEIRRIAPSTKIVFFSMHDVPAVARQIGADAFVSKSSGAEELVATIERVINRPEEAAKKKCARNAS
jgi:DNA-binding NarL/FixJ family response regulator